MITVHLYYTGTNGAARRFAEEMESSWKNIMKQVRIFVGISLER